MVYISDIWSIFMAVEASFEVLGTAAVTYHQSTKVCHKYRVTHLVVNLG